LLLLNHLPSNALSQHASPSRRYLKAETQMSSPRIFPVNIIYRRDVQQNFVFEYSLSTPRPNIPKVRHPGHPYGIYRSDVQQNLVFQYSLSKIPPIPKARLSHLWKNILMVYIGAMCNKTSSRDIHFNRGSEEPGSKEEIT